MTIPFVTSNAMGFALADVFTPPSAGDYNYGASPAAALGTIVLASDGSQWVYVLFGSGGVTGLGYVVVVDEAFGAVMMSNSVGGLGDPIAVAPAAASSGDYGWVQRFGTCDDIRVTASCNPNVALASTTTAGQIDDSVANPTKNLTGIILTTVRGGTDGNAPGYLNWPVVGTTN